MEKKKKYTAFLSLIYFFVFSIFLILLGVSFDLINEPLFTVDGLFLLSIIIIIRILMFFSMSVYLFHKWFNQESFYISDAFFLFGLFFLMLVIGKLFDLFYNMAYFVTYFEIYSLFLLKVRYFIIIVTILPPLYIGLEFLILIFTEYIKDLSDSQFSKLRLLIISIFFGIVSILIIITPNITQLTQIYPIMVLGTAIGIIFMFLFMYKNKRLSQANGLIIGIGFALFIFSSILRGILARSGEPLGIIIAELIDNIIYLVIFTGFIAKPKYAKS